MTCMWHQPKKVGYHANGYSDSYADRYYCEIKTSAEKIQKYSLKKIALNTWAFHDYLAIDGSLLSLQQ